MIIYNTAQSCLDDVELNFILSFDFVRSKGNINQVHSWTHDLTHFMHPFDIEKCMELLHSEYKETLNRMSEDGEIP